MSVMSVRLSLHNPDKKFAASIKRLRYEVKKELSLLQSHPRECPKIRRKELLQKIQDIILRTVKSLASSKDPSLSLQPRRSQWKDCDFSQGQGMRLKEGHHLVEIKYTTHKQRFEIIFNLLSKIYRLLLCKGSLTKRWDVTTRIPLARELYYEDVALFGSQRVVEAALRDCASLLCARPWELRVFPTSKGLVAGRLRLTTADRCVLDCDRPGGVQVPQDVKGILKIESTANFILVVEKDAAFQKLLDDGAHYRHGPCIIITGKGEPDLNTRLLVNRLSRELLIPVLILVDADPYGIEIMCTYRFGSLAMSGLGGSELAVPEARWLGVHPTDLTQLAIPGVALLTARDRAKANDLAARPYVQSHPALLEQVNCILDEGRKCEIENLSKISSHFLPDMFLHYKITSDELI